MASRFVLQLRPIGEDGVGPPIAADEIVVFDDQVLSDLRVLVTRRMIPSGIKSSQIEIDWDFTVALEYGELTDGF